MKKGEIAFYLAFIAIAVAAFFYAGTFPSDAAYFPRLVSALIILFCAVLMLRCIRKGLAARRAAAEAGTAVAAAADEAKERRMAALKVVILTAMLLGYCLVFNKLGYVISTVLLVAASIYLYGNRNWKTIAVTSVLLTVALYVIFRFLLKVNFPSDALFF